MTQNMSALNVTPAADPGRWPDIAAVPRCPFRGAVARARPRGRLTALLNRAFR